MKPKKLREVLYDVTMADLVTSLKSRGVNIDQLTEDDWDDLAELLWEEMDAAFENIMDSEIQDWI